MAGQMDVIPKEPVKTQFSSIDGCYKVLPQCEYSRPNRLNYNNTNVGTIPQMRVSFSDCYQMSDSSKICFNYGREIYVYRYKGLKKVSFCLILLWLLLKKYSSGLSS